MNKVIVVMAQILLDAMLRQERGDLILNWSQTARGDLRRKRRRADPEKL